jgi:DNA polymerase-3 subunit delta
MFGDRLIVMRNVSRFGTEDLAPLVSYLADPNPTSQLLIVWDKPASPGGKAHAIPKKLTEAVKACGGAVADSDVAPNAKLRQGWIDEHLRAASVRFSPQAASLIAARLGEDVARLGGVLRLLESVFAEGSTLSPEQIEPYLGDAGSVPPWELTDAIDKGDVPGAVDKVRRMLHAGERHPLVVMVTLSTHFQKMLKLDGAAVANETEAAALLGMKKGSTFPAKKAMTQARQLGSKKIAEAIRLLAAADVDLRGGTAMDPEAVIVVLVGRLAALSRQPNRRPTGPRR